MNKQNFVEIITALQNQYDYDVKRVKDLEVIFGEGVQMPENYLLTNQLLKILHDAFPPDDQNSMIEEFCYTHNFGRLLEDYDVNDLWKDLVNEIEVVYEKIEK